MAFQPVSARSTVVVATVVISVAVTDTLSIPMLSWAAPEGPFMNAKTSWPEALTGVPRVIVTPVSAPSRTALLPLPTDATVDGEPDAPFRNSQLPDTLPPFDPDVVNLA